MSTIRDWIKINRCLGGFGANKAIIDSGKSDDR